MIAIRTQHVLARKQWGTEKNKMLSKKKGPVARASAITGGGGRQ